MKNIQAIRDVYLENPNGFLFLSTKSITSNIGVLQTTYQEHSLKGILQKMSREVLELPHVKKMFKMDGNSIRWYSLCSLRRHVGAYITIWESSQSTVTKQALESVGKHALVSLSEYAMNLNFLNRIPSAMEEFPVCTVFAFVAWECLVRRSADRDIDMSAVHRSLEEVIAEVNEVLGMTDGTVRCRDFIAHTMNLLRCFEDSLPFGTTFDGRGKAVFRGIQEESRKRYSFSAPSEDDVCLYHKIDPSWIESVEKLANVSLEMAAIMSQYVMDMEVCSKNKRTNSRPVAYRGCILDGTPMLRCVVLQGLLLSFYGSLQPIVEHLCREEELFSSPDDFLKQSVQPLLLQVLQVAFLSGQKGKTFLDAHATVILNFSKNEPLSEINDNGSS